jgi:hypothetical protein
VVDISRLVDRRRRKVRLTETGGNLYDIEIENLHVL